MAHDSALRPLADRVGILSDYVDQTGTERRVTTDETRVAILAAMGIDASTEPRAAAALESLLERERDEIVSPVRVVAVDDPSAMTVEVRVPARLSRSPAPNATWHLELVTESGDRHAAEGHWDGGTSARLAIPVDASLGYHSVNVRINVGPREWSAEQSLVVVPPRCTPPAALLGGARAFGLIANLYSLHSDRNWGIGDLTDLATLATWAGAVGGAFVGVNPLHALLNRGPDISPYSPVSRLFRNPAYIDVEAVVELADAARIRDRLAAPELNAELALLRESPRVNYERVMELKTPALEALYRAFRERSADDPRARAYASYVRAQDPELTRFATYMALGEGPGRQSWDWRGWPPELRRPDSESVARFQREHADRVDYNRWLQFELDRQLAGAAAAGARAGLAVGLYQDLAIGTSPAGSDVWSMPELFVAGASIGAPPDPYAPEGQNWGLPPLDPRALREDRYRYFIRLLRAGFEHAGALRIDHAMAFFRMFWIPEGLSGREGAYVRYPSAELLGILALESVRHRALVVGEDLGTVPHEVPPAFEKWGILSSKVLYFERDGRGEFKPPAEYAALALATANTHDLPTLAGFWSGRDIELRRQVGLVADDAAVARAYGERAGDRSSLLARLAEAGAPSDLASMERDNAAFRGAVHQFLCASPSVLVGLSLDDLVGEVDPVNQPGVGPDKYPSWTRKMGMALEDVPDSEAVRSALRCEGRNLRGPARPEPPSASAESP